MVDLTRKQQIRAAFELLIYRPTIRDIGAIGVSGVQSHENEQVAKAGIDALG